jgi:hypothetical protein
MVGAGLLRQSLLPEGIQLSKREQKGGHREGCEALEEKTESWAIHVPSQCRSPSAVVRDGERSVRINPPGRALLRLIWGIRGSRRRGPPTGVNGLRKKAWFWILVAGEL